MDFTINVPYRDYPYARVKFTLETSAGGDIKVDGTTLASGAQSIDGDVWELTTDGNDLHVDVMLYSNFDTTTDLTVLRMPDPGDPPIHPRELPFTFTPASGGTVDAVRISGYVVPNEWQKGCATRRADDPPVSFIVLPTTSPPIEEKRQPLDVLLVLDRSGSMSSPIPSSLGGDGTTPKMDHLQTCVSKFLTLWRMEATHVDEDRLGLIWFSTAADVSESLTRRDAESPAWDTIEGAVASKTASGRTALGDGISEAVAIKDSLPDLDDPAVVLLSDGLQNEGCQIEKDTSPPPPNLMEYCTPVGGPNRETLSSVCMPMHTIGIGASGDALSILLNDIAAETGGTTTNVTDAVAMCDAWMNNLVEMLKGNSLSVIGRHEGTLRAGVKEDTVTFEFDNTVQQVLALLSWQHSTSALLLHFTRPDGRSGRPVETENRDFYLVSSLLPNRSGPPGTWQARIVHNEHTFELDIDYTLRLLVTEGLLSYSVSVPDGKPATGDKLPLRIVVADGKQPLTGIADDINIRVRGPRMALGTYLHNKRISPERLVNPPEGFDPDTFPTRGSRKIYYLAEEQDLGKQLVPTDLGTFTPSEIADGIYEFIFNQTQLPGIYTFETVIDTNLTAGRVHRVDNREVAVSIQEADPTRSTITTTDLGDGVYGLTVTPADRFDNVLGPDHPSMLDIRVGKRRIPPVRLEDKAARGIYQTTLSNIQPGSDPVITISFGGRTLKQGPLSQLVEEDGDTRTPLKGCLEALLAVLLVVIDWLRGKHKNNSS